MSASPTGQSKAAGALSMVAVLASASAGLQQALLSLASCHHGQPGPWLDQLEAAMIRNTKNMTFTGTSMEAEAAAVEAALANLALVFGQVRRKLQPERPVTVSARKSRT